jgi:hypothetical protein
MGLGSCGRMYGGDLDGWIGLDACLGEGKVDPDVRTGVDVVTDQIPNEPLLLFFFVLLQPLAFIHICIMYVYITSATLADEPLIHFLVYSKPMLSSSSLLHPDLAPAW